MVEVGVLWQKKVEEDPALVTSHAKRFIDSLLSRQELQMDVLPLPYNMISEEEKRVAENQRVQHQRQREGEDLEFCYGLLERGVVARLGLDELALSVRYGRALVFQRTELQQSWSMVQGECTENLGITLACFLTKEDGQEPGKGRGEFKERRTSGYPGEEVPVALKISGDLMSPGVPPVSAGGSAAALDGPEGPIWRYVASPNQSFLPTCCNTGVGRAGQPKVKPGQANLMECSAPHLGLPVTLEKEELLVINNKPVVYSFSGVGQGKFLGPEAGEAKAAGVLQWIKRMTVRLGVVTIPKSVLNARGIFQCLHRRRIFHIEGTPKARLFSDLDEGEDQPPLGATGRHKGGDRSSARLPGSPGFRRDRPFLVMTTAGCELEAVWQVYTDYWDQGEVVGTLKEAAAGQKEMSEWRRSVHEAYERRGVPGSDGGGLGQCEAERLGPLCDGLVAQRWMQAAGSHWPSLTRARKEIATAIHHLGEFIGRWGGDWVRVLSPHERQYLVKIFIHPQLMCLNLRMPPFVMNKVSDARERGVEGGRSFMVSKEGYNHLTKEGLRDAGVRGDQAGLDELCDGIDSSREELYFEGEARGVKVKTMVEEVQSMNRKGTHHGDDISELLAVKPLTHCVSESSDTQRPRYCWLEGDLCGSEGLVILEEVGFTHITMEGKPPAATWALQRGATRTTEEVPFAALVHSFLERRPPRAPTGLARTSLEAVALSTAEQIRYPPHQWEAPNLGCDNAPGANLEFCGAFWTLTRALQERRHLNKGRQLPDCCSVCGRTLSGETPHRCHLRKRTSSWTEVWGHTPCSAGLSGEADPFLVEHFDKTRGFPGEGWRYASTRWPKWRRRLRRTRHRSSELVLKEQIKDTYFKVMSSLIQRRHRLWQIELAITTLESAILSTAIVVSEREAIAWSLLVDEYGIQRDLTLGAYSDTAHVLGLCSRVLDAEFMRRYGQQSPLPDGWSCHPRVRRICRWALRLAWTPSP